MVARIYSLFTHQTGGPPEAPTNLVTSDVTHQSFRATWTPPEDPPERYRVEYTSPSGLSTQVPSILPDETKRDLFVLTFKKSCQ